MAAVFAAAAGREEALEAGLADLAGTRADLAAARRAPGLSPYGRLLIDFRDRLAEAHEEALRGLEALAGRAGGDPSTHGS